mgnify:CR=1 FL=1
MVPKDKLVGVVISGGKSSRMGTDKSLLLWNNKPFYLHTAEILAPFCSEIYVSCNVSQSNNYILPVIIDKYGSYGPISGVLSSMRALSGCSIITLPCDMPELSESIINEMISTNKEKQDGVFLKDDNNQLEPMLAIYNPSIYSKMLAWYDSGNYSLKKFIESCNNVSYIKLGAQSLININTTKELDNLKRKN